MKIKIHKFRSGAHRNQINHYHRSQGKIGGGIKSKLKSKCQGTKLKRQHTSGLKRIIHRERQYCRDIVTGVSLLTHRVKPQNQSLSFPPKPITDLQSSPAHQ